jgi:CMP/dCMP kinase
MRIDLGRQLAHFNSRPRPGDLPLRIYTPASERLSVAISRLAGSGAMQIAEGLARYLQAHMPETDPPWRVFDRTLMAKVLEDHHLPTRLAEVLREDAPSAVDDMVQELLGLHPPSWMIVQQSIETILQLARAGNVILMGWGVNAVTSKLPNVLHVRLVASLERRIARIQTREHLSRKEALLLIQRLDRGRERYVRKYFHQKVSDVLQYSLVFNTDHFSEGQVAQFIGDAVLQRQGSACIGGSPIAVSATVS